MARTDGPAAGLHNVTSMHCHVCGPILVVTTEMCFIPGALGNATRICWYACVRLELMERCKLAHGDRALGVVVGMETGHADS